MARLSHSFTRLSSSILLSLLIASASAAPAQEARKESFPPKGCTPSSVKWSSCPADAGLPEKLKCATFSVPIDWNKPKGDHFDLGLVKLPAASSKDVKKIGPLFVNPGGPGGSGVGLVAQIAAGALQDETLLASFDWIGLDPRGVGLSHQIECDMKIFAERVSLFPQTQEDYDKLVDKNKRLGASCKKLTGPLLDHVDTLSVAKDFEAIRVALGNEPFNFLGESYGSQIGSQYAQLFPDNIRAMALDGITLHSQNQASNLLTEASSYQVGLKHFFEWAGENETSALKGQDVEKVWTSLIEQADKKPIPAAGCNGTDCATDVNGEEIQFNSQGYMVIASGDTSLGTSWGVLASAIYNATKGDASALSRRFDSITDTAGLAIACQDWTHTSSFADSLQKQTLAATFTPLNRGASQTWGFQQQCNGWPAPVVNPPEKLNVKSKTTILLVNSESDPETSYTWAVGMTEEIKNSVLVTRKGDGHTSFVLGGETAQAMGQYLLTGEAPKQNLYFDS